MNPSGFVNQDARKRAVDAKVKAATGKHLRDLPKQAIYRAVWDCSPAMHVAGLVKEDLITCFYLYAVGRYGPAMLDSLAKETTRLQQLKEARTHV